MISQDTVECLMAVAPEVHKLLPLLITFMSATGRRLGSVLGLRWNDFDFEQQTIRWRPELDKRRRTWITPLPRQVDMALRRTRTEWKAIGTALVLPSAGNPDKPVSQAP